MALILASFYALLIVILYFAQDALIFPGHRSQGTRGAEFRTPSGCEIASLKTPDGLRVMAVFGPALSADGLPRIDAKTRPTLLYFYGNGEHLAVSLGKLDALRRRGVNAMMVDYLGFGLSEGNAGEAGCIAAADAAYEHLRLRADIDPNNIVIGGFSIGGAVAIDLASRKKSSGLIVSCTFTSMTEMAWRQYPFLPVSLVLSHRFQSREKIAKVNVPILIATGANDWMIPASMSDVLAKSAKGEVSRILMKRAGHDDLIRIALEDGEVSTALDRFLDALR